MKALNVYALPNPKNVTANVPATTNQPRKMRGAERGRSLLTAAFLLYPERVGVHAAQFDWLGQRAIVAVAATDYAMAIADDLHASPAR